MSTPRQRGQWKLEYERDLRNGKYEHWVCESRTSGTEIEEHIHLPDDETVVVTPEGELKVFLKDKSRLVCQKCGVVIVEGCELDMLGDILKEMHRNREQAETQVLHHVWERHREDFPAELKSYTAMRQWLHTPAGKAWEAEGAQLAPEEVVAEAEKIFQETPKVRKCRVCGCDDLHACVTKEGPCHWVGPDLCSGCAEKAKR